MDEMNNAYSGIAHTSSDFKERMIRTVRDNFAFIILVFNILLRIALELFDASVSNPFTVDFFIKLGTDIATTMFCYVCFISYGAKMEKSTLQAYRNNAALWAQLSEGVRKSHNEAFSEFCRVCAEEEREERRKAIIQNNTMVPYDRFEKEYRGKSKKDIAALVKDGTLDRIDAYYVNKANGVIRVKPINPLLILCGVKATSLNDVGRDGISPSTISALSRPVSMFVLSAIIEMLHGAWRGISTGEEVYNMLLSVLMIVISSVVGYSAGVNAARKEHDKIKGRIFFLEKFNQRRSEISASE